MLNEATDGRRQRGLEIAATQVITENYGKGLDGRGWMVPSQSGPGRYRVERESEGFKCACPDFELTGRTCKHGFAVEFMLRREMKPDGTVIETRAARVTYSQNWPAYNKAQTTEKAQFCVLLRDLVADVPNPEYGRGRPPLPLSDMIFSAAFKVYSTVSGRRFMTDLRGATDAGFIDKTPHYNSIFNVLDRESLTPILTDLITRSAMPLKSLETDFAVDSTGFGTQCFYRHFSAKYGRDVERRSFVKVHAMIGTKTNVVTAVVVTDEHTGDSPMLAPLVTETAESFNVQRVSADKAYASVFNFDLIESFGAQPLVPFKSNAVENNKSSTWNRLFHYFQFQRDEFLAKYHRRSNVESTFSAMKRKFGDTIRSKSPVAQRNEALLKVLCHNIVCLIHEISESGATAMFPALTSCPTKATPALEVIDVP
jgi:transposase